MLVLEAQLLCACRLTLVTKIEKLFLTVTKQLKLAFLLELSVFLVTVKK